MRYMPLPFNWIVLDSCRSPSVWCSLACLDRMSGSIDRVYLLQYRGL